MRRFEKITLLFVLPLLVLVVAGETLIRVTPNIYSYKHSWMEKHGSEVTTLVLGSSHNLAAMCPSDLGDSVFNLAIGAQRPEYDLMLLEQFAPQCPHLRTVITNLDVNNYFSRDYEDTYRYYFATYYTLFMGSKKHHFPSLYHLMMSHPRYASTLAMKCALYKLRGKSMIECDSLGWSTDSVRPPRGLAMTDQQRDPVSESDVMKNRERMERMIDYCNAHGLRLVVVTTPMWHTYRDAIDPELKLQFNAEMQRLRQHGLKEYRDYSDDLRFQANDFYDSHHLWIVNGSHKFTKILKEDLGL